MKNLDKHPGFLNLIEERKTKVEKEYKNKKYRMAGSSTLIYKKREYSGFKRKNVER